MRLNRKTVSTWASMVVLVAAAFGGVVALAGGAAASGGPCGVVVSGENLAQDALQTAISAAHAGQTICVHAGVYPEQIVVSTPDLKIVGAGVGLTVIDPSSGTVNAVDWDSAASPHSPKSSLYPVIAVVLVANVSGVVLKHLTVNAAGAASSIAGCSPGIAAVDFQNVSSGKLVQAAIENAKLSPALLGCQFQIGVYAYTGYYETGYTPAGATVTVRGTSITNYGKGGIVCNDPGLTCKANGDTVTGIGETAAIGQNGIQVAFGALGLITNDHVSGNAYDGTNGDSATVADDNDFFGNGTSVGGVLLYLAASGTRVTGCTFVNNQVGVLAYGDALDQIRHNIVTNSYAYGIVDYGEPGAISHIVGNTVSNPTTGAVGILVVNGTFYVTGNSLSGTSLTGTQGASQAVTGPGSYNPTYPATSIATAAVQAISDGALTHVFLTNNLYTHVSSRSATVAVFDGMVVVTT